MSKVQIRIGGLGGQGVIMAGMIVGKAASIYDQKQAAMIQSFGPEARGSACSAQVTVDDAFIGYPYVDEVDVLVAMSQEAFDLWMERLELKEPDRFLPRLRNVVDVLVQDDWWFDRETLQAKLPVN